MTRSNVDIMREAIEAFNQRDPAALAELFAEDAEIVPVRAAVEGTVYKGRNGPAEYCAAVDESWIGLRWEVSQIYSDAEWVLATGRIRGHGRGSGATIDLRAGWVAYFVDGRIMRFQTYPDRTQAFEAVGLRDSSDP